MTTKRFGARYGKRVKDRLRTIEKAESKGQLCPYCRKPKVRRISLGIFECTKCNAKFTGKAYFVGRKKAMPSGRMPEPALEEENAEEELLDEEPESLEAEETEVGVTYKEPRAQEAEQAEEEPEDEESSEDEADDGREGMIDNG